MHKLLQPPKFIHEKAALTQGPGVGTDPRFRQLPTGLRQAIGRQAHEAAREWVPADARFQRSRIGDTPQVRSPESVAIASPRVDPAPSIAEVVTAPEQFKKVPTYQTQTRPGLSPVPEAGKVKSILPEVEISGPEPPVSSGPDSRADICARLKDALSNFERQPDDSGLRDLIGRLTRKLANTRLGTLSGTNLKLCVKVFWGKGSSKLAFKRTAQEVAKEAISMTPGLERARADQHTLLKKLSAIHFRI